MRPLRFRTTQWLLPVCAGRLRAACRIGFGSTWSSTTASLVLSVADRLARYLIAHPGDPLSTRPTWRGDSNGRRAEYRPRKLDIDKPLDLGVIEKHVFEIRIMESQSRRPSQQRQLCAFAGLNDPLWYSLSHQFPCPQISKVLDCDLKFRRRPRDPLR
jgi:hypothetical protein